MWFTEWYGNNIGRITTSGTVTEYPILTARSYLAGITAGPDGNIWFTKFAASQIGRVTPGGTVTEYPTPTPSSDPGEITTGPDGALWFAVLNGRIARAPACGIGLSATFAEHRLTMNFDLGINTPATWSISAGPFGLNRPIGAVVPPRAFTKSWGNFPDQGKVMVTSTLSDQSGQALCSEWTTVNTAPSN